MAPQPLQAAALKLAGKLNASLSDAEHAALQDYVDHGGDFMDLIDMARKHPMWFRPISGNVGTRRSTHAERVAGNDGPIDTPPDVVRAGLPR